MAVNRIYFRMTNWKFAMFVLFFTPQIIKASFPCKKNEYIIKNGSKPCLPCNNCPEGLGLKPPCGSILFHPPKIECFPCETGKYSDAYDPSSCKGCHHCSKHEIVTKKCTSMSNTICSGTCESGWYYENATHNCQPCSYCCGDDDIIIRECLPSPKHCSIHNALKCTPTTVTVMTTNVTSIITTSRNGLNKKSIELLIGFSILGAVFGIGIIVLLVYFYKRRKKERLKKHPANGDAENPACYPLNTCGLSKFKLCLEIVDYNKGPYKKTVLFQEGKDLTLTVAVAAQDNEDDCFKQCGFNWRKDDYPLNYCEDKELKKDNIKVEDSGKYQCSMCCHTHHFDKSTDEVVIHVQPIPPKRLMLLNEIGLTMKEKVANILKIKTPDVGNWQNVGEHYGMDKITLESLKDDEDRADQVLRYLGTKCPDLTVFDFCEYLKSIKQIQMVNMLKLKHLTVDEERVQIVEENSTASMNESRDSGVEFDGECGLQVNLPPEYKSDSVDGPTDVVVVPDIDFGPSAVNGLESKPAIPTTNLLKKYHTNLSYSDSSRDTSREGSLDELPIIRPSSRNKNKRDNDDQSTGGKRPRKRSFTRQTSKESSKSAGAVSIGSLKDAVAAKFTKRNDSYTEHQDTEDDEL